MFWGKGMTGTMAPHNVVSTHGDNRPPASTQNQALSSLLFLYRRLLNCDIDRLRKVMPESEPIRVPMMMNHEQTKETLTSGPTVYFSIMIFNKGGVMKNLIHTVTCKVFWSWICIFMLAGCAPLIGPYSPTAYQNATSLKAGTLALMEKATEPYAAHQKEVESLLVEMDKAYEFVKGIPSNSISAKQWNILKKPEGDLLGKYILRWKENTTLTQTYINEFKGLIADAFDEIICLEANKKEATKCNEKGGN
jgi:hypothetical protein